MSTDIRFNRNRRDLNVNSKAIALMNVDDVKMRREHAEYVGRTMFDFDVGDEVELNPNRKLTPVEYFKGTVVAVDCYMIRVVPDMGDIYNFINVHRENIRPVVNP